MDWLLNLIPGGGLTAIVAAIFAGLAFLGTLMHKSAKGARAEERVKQYERERENLEAIKRAADAKPTGSVHDDPHNRDNWDKP